MQKEETHEPLHISVFMNSGIRSFKSLAFSKFNNWKQYDFGIQKPVNTVIQALNRLVSAASHKQEGGIVWKYLSCVLNSFSILVVVTFSTLHFIDLLEINPS